MSCVCADRVGSLSRCSAPKPFAAARCDLPPFPAQAPAWDDACCSGAFIPSIHLAGPLYDWYNAWLEESPLLCKIVTGNIFTVIGDLLAQASSSCGEPHGGGTSSQSKPCYDVGRTLRLCIETSVFGTPLAHYW